VVSDTDADGRRHLVVALAANAAAAAFKLAAFALTGASVLLSEGLHSIADCGNQGALLLGRRGASAPASPAHPLGRGRARYVWAFLVAVVVFGGSAIGSLADATYRLLNPEHHEQIGLTLAVLAVATVIEGISFSSIVRDAAAARRPGESWVGFVSRSRDPDLPLLLVEDVVDLIGLGLALVGTLAADLTGAPVLDAVASYLIAALLASNAVFLARRMASLLLGEAPDHEVEAAVLAAVGSTGSLRSAAVEAVHLGPDDLLIIVGLTAGAGEPDGATLGWLAQAKQLAAGATPLRSRVVFDVPAGTDPPPGAPDASAS
jgi:cation diffusion facilitator family transporter